MGKRTVTIIHDAVTAKIMKPTDKVRLLVNEMLSYQVAGADHMQGGWNGRQSFYSTKTDKFPAGFRRLVQKRLQRQGFKVVIKGKDAPEPLGPREPKVDDFGYVDKYSYQVKVADRLLSLRGMIAQVATGGGKSRIFKICAERIGRPTLFLTTRKTLMYQMRDDYAETVGKPHGIIGDSVWSPVAGGVNFAIVDTLAERLSQKSVKKIAEDLLLTAQATVEVKIEEALRDRKLPTDHTMLPYAKPMVKEAVMKVRKAFIKKNPIDKKDISRRAREKYAAQKARREETIALLKGFDFVCIEEAHEVSSSSFYAVMNQCTNAHYRLALTATPFMKDDEEANMRLMAVSGTIGVKVSEKELIDLGILAKPYFMFMPLSKPKKVFRTTAYQRAYKFGIVENNERNTDIVCQALDAKKFGLPIMVLVQHQAHGKKLNRMLNDAGLRAAFIFGKHSQKNRQAALNALKAGHLDAVIGSTILDVGVDVPAIGLVIIAGGGKAEYSMRQRVGRGLRAKSSGPNVAFIIDFSDTGNSHLAKHARERRRIIEQTPGFGENIVTKLDYAKYGFKEAA